MSRVERRLLEAADAITAEVHMLELINASRVRGWVQALLLAAVLLGIATNGVCVAAAIPLAVFFGVSSTADSVLMKS